MRRDSVQTDLRRN